MNMHKQGAQPCKFCNRDNIKIQQPLNYTFKLNTHTRLCIYDLHILEALHTISSLKKPL